MFENIISRITPEMAKVHQARKARRERNLQTMLKFLTDLQSRYPTLNCDEYNAAKLLDIAEFVRPCEKCDKKVCNRPVCKLVTIDEIALYRGEISPRYNPNCRALGYYPTFAMLAHTMHTE